MIVSYGLLEILLECLLSLDEFHIPNSKIMDRKASRHFNADISDMTCLFTCNIVSCFNT